MEQETISLYIFTPPVRDSRSIESETDETDANISAVGDPFARLFASKYTNTHAEEEEEGEPSIFNTRYIRARTFAPRAQATSRLRLGLPPPPLPWASLEPSGAFNIYVHAYIFSRP